MLLEKVLSAGNQAVIGKTMQRLPATDAAALLHAVAERLLSRPARAAMLLPWLRAALLHHSTYLAAAPSAQADLAAVRRAAEARAAALPEVLALRGRLDLVLALSQHAPPATLGDVDAPLVRTRPCARRPCAQRAPLGRSLLPDGRHGLDSMPPATHPTHGTA